MSDLTRAEWLYLSRLVLSAGPIFAPGPTDREVFTMVAIRTVTYQKFEERLLFPCFTRGDARVAWFPSPSLRTSIHRSWKRLITRNVLSSHGTGRTRSETRVRLEVASMLVCMSYLWKEPMVANLREKLLSYWSARQWEVPEIPITKEVVVSIADHVKQGMERSREAMKRRSLKRASVRAEDVKPSWVFSIMRDACVALGIKYADTLPTAKEQGMAFGSAKNFVEYCKRDGVDPRALLVEACERWGEMSGGNLVSLEGKTIQLSSIVSFMDFFRYRREIIKWLEEHRGSKPQFEWDVQ